MILKRQLFLKALTVQLVFVFSEVFFNKITHFIYRKLVQYKDPPASQLRRGFDDFITSTLSYRNQHKAETFDNYNDRCKMSCLNTCYVPHSDIIVPLQCIDLTLMLFSV